MPPKVQTIGPSHSYQTSHQLGEPHGHRRVCVIHKSCLTAASPKDTQKWVEHVTFTEQAQLPRPRSKTIKLIDHRTVHRQQTLGCHMQKSQETDKVTNKGRQWVDDTDRRRLFVCMCAYVCVTCALYRRQSLIHSVIVSVGMIVRVVHLHTHPSPSIRIHTHRDQGS